MWNVKGRGGQTETTTRHCGASLLLGGRAHCVSLVPGLTGALVGVSCLAGMVAHLAVAVCVSVLLSANVVVVVTVLMQLVVPPLALLPECLI